jgi:hypothetical protein
LKFFHGKMLVIGTENYAQLMGYLAHLGELTEQLEY